MPRNSTGLVPPIRCGDAVKVACSPRLGRRGRGGCKLAIERAVARNLTAAGGSGPGRVQKQELRTLYLHRPAQLDAVFTTLLLVRGTGVVNGTTARWLWNLQRLAQWARAAGCRMAIGVLERAGRWFRDLRQSYVPRPPKAPFLLRIRQGFQGRRYVDLLGSGMPATPATDFELASRFDCLPSAPMREHEQRGWGVERGFWGSYLRLYNRDGAKGPMFWGTEPLLPVDSRGMFRLPSGVDSIVLDIGVDVYSSCANFLKYVNFLVIGVEPRVVGIEQLELTARCEMLHFQRRMWLLRAAVGPLSMGPYARLHHTASPACSSVHAPSSLADTGDCATVTAVSEVPVLPLTELLWRCPVEVQLLKIDVQGADLQVLMSGGEHLHKVRRIEVECQALPRGDSRLLYPQGHTKGELVAFLRERRFRLSRCEPNTASGELHPLLEENCFFDRI